MRGRKPKPSAEKAAEGNPGKRRYNKIDAAEPSQEPDCPKHLDARARSLWSRLTPLLMRRKFLKLEDQIQLANLCQAWSMLVEAREEMDQLQLVARAKLGKRKKGEKLRRSKLLVVSPSGYLQQNPLIGIINTQVGIIHRLGAVFGLSPADRTRLTNDDDIPLDRLDELERILGGDDERLATDTTIM